MHGSIAYMSNANTYLFRKKLIKQMEDKFPSQVSKIEINRYLKHNKQDNKKIRDLRDIKKVYENKKA